MDAVVSSLTRLVLAARGSDVIAALVVALIVVWLTRSSQGARRADRHLWYAGFALLGLLEGAFIVKLFL